MHIVFITSEYPTLKPKHGGIGTFVSTIAKELNKKGINVTVLGLYHIESEIEIDDNNVKIIGIPFSHWKFAKFIQNYRRVLKKIHELNNTHHIDIIEGAESTFAFFPRKTSYKKIIRMHGGHLFFADTLGNKTSFWKTYQEKKSFEKAEGIIAVSGFVGSKTMKLLGLNKQYQIIYNPINLENFTIKNNPNKVSNSLLFIGTLTEKKGISQLLEAIPLVMEKFNDVTLTIIGRDTTIENGTSYQSFLESMIPNDFRKCITFVGNIEFDKISQYLEKTEIAIYPSHSESFGLTVIEALAMEKPVIVSDIDVFKEIVDDKCVRFFESKNSIDLANQIQWMLENKEKAFKLGKQGFHKVKNTYTIDKLIIENITFYHNILKVI